jgi:hypothetical protein
VTDNDKQSRLLRCENNYDHKKFYSKCLLFDLELSFFTQMSKIKFFNHFSIFLSRPLQFREEADTHFQRFSTEPVFHVQEETRALDGGFVFAIRCQKLSFSVTDGESK